METREKKLIRFLRNDHFLYHISTKEEAPDIIKEINDILAKYDAGTVAEWFVFSEREYVCTFNYVKNRVYSRMMGKKDTYILSYKIEIYNDRDTRFYKEIVPYCSPLLYVHSTFWELSECFCPTVEDVEYLLSNYRTIGFGKINNKPIKWIVLNEDEDRLLLLSKYLIKKDYLLNYETSNKFKDSNTFKYLNSDFYDSAFDDIEKARIIDADGCKVRIISFREIECYFSTNYLYLKRPCRHDFGIAGIYKDQILPYFIMSETDYLSIVEYNGCRSMLLFTEDDDTEYGIRPVIEIVK